ncbi:MAG: hypothetical protein H6918_08725 [Sphingomonadaceae bacterium]|nr:hypothetical protein [Sphingomonadaceae bacterium]
MILTIVVGMVFAGGPDRFLSFTIVLMVGTLISTLLHELGHLVAGWIVGWRLVVINVMGLSLHWWNMRFHLDKPDIAADAGGWVVMIPDSAAALTPFRHLVMVAGGPLVSLAQTVVGISLAILAYKGPFFGPFALDVVGLGLAFFGLITFLGTAIPSKRAESNDASTILRDFAMWRSGERFDPAAWLALLLQYNVRLRELPEWLIADAINYHAESDYADRYFRSLEIGIALDAKQVDANRALGLIEEYEQLFGIDDWLACCRAYCEAAHLHDLTAARRSMEKAGFPSSLPQMDYAARAAIAMLEGDRGNAMELLKLMDAEIAAKSPFRDMTFRDIRKQITALQKIGT